MTTLNDEIRNDGPDDDDDVIHAMIRRGKRREERLRKTDYIWLTEAGEAEIRFAPMMFPTETVWAATFKLFGTPAHDYYVTFSYNTSVEEWRIVLDHSIPQLKDYRWVKAVWHDFITEHPEILEYVKEYNAAMKNLPVLLTALNEMQRKMRWLGTGDMKDVDMTANVKAINAMMKVWEAE